MKKPYIKILFAASILILLLLSAKELNNNAKFVDSNFRTNVSNQIRKENPKEEDLLNITALTFTQDERIDNFSDLKKFIALDYLALRGFSQNEINAILENCPTVLSHLNISGDNNYSLGGTVLSASEEVLISTSEQLTVHHIKNTDTVCKRLLLSGKEIKGINNIGILKNMEFFDLGAEDGFDTELDCAAIAENSPAISVLIVSGGKVSNYEAIESMNNLERLILNNAAIKNAVWAEALTAKIDHLLIREEGEFLIENIFDDN